ncbi:unnamed protein product [Pieris macdunnoughi]|uniref:Uncharacterized protein n=1 Tax=Pieris macdunnoughi TaxID=345717 RepID=A0A821YAC5_9NEOP|nr:unnamed protein product [Pieris macdunnoughi]
MQARKTTAPYLAARRSDSRKVARTLATTEPGISSTALNTRLTLSNWRRQQRRGAPERSDTSSRSLR